jgi:hypothetical protein
MPRHIRTAFLLLIAFYLLTSAATALAECAWVLWDHGFASVRGVTEEFWIVRDAFDTKSRCEEHARLEDVKIQQEFRQAPEEMKRTGAAVIREARLCLPDTVDPRGPRGGGR